ncbi:MAG: cation:proton antiporter [Betaproteobacteria bacterium]|nr:cation:proton antiporter [Betaproteobacteria bacterium]
MSAFNFLPSFPLPPNLVLLFGLLLLAGFAGGELVQRMLRLPRITGYVLVGLVLGASGFGVIDKRLAGEAQMFVNIGLGIILFELGRRLDFGWLRRDRWFAATALAESALSFFCMYGALAYFGIHPLHATVAAAIGVATSPAVVMLVAQELRAEGQVTERALNLVAINSVAAFVLATTLLSWLHHEYRASWITMVSHPVYLLGGSLLIGYLASGAAILLARWIGKREELQLVMLLGMIVLAVGCADALNLSVMLSLLAFGVASRNLDRNHDLMQVNIGHIGQIFFVVLFVVTGAILNVNDFITGGAIAMVYILARFVGKAIGVLSLAHFSGIRPGSGGLLCLALTPMSGLAIEMMHGTTSLYPEFGAKLAPIVLSAVLLLELIGPVAVQFALRTAGEAQEESK